MVQDVSSMGCDKELLKSLPITPLQSLAINPPEEITEQFL